MTSTRDAFIQSLRNFHSIYIQLSVKKYKKHKSIYFFINMTRTIIAKSLSQHDEKHVARTPLSGIRVGGRYGVQATY
jgi:hypothetical protein